jgi:hypothetical protein
MRDHVLHIQRTSGNALIDDAMTVIERQNLSLKGVLPKTYARPQLDKHRLGELIDLIATIGLGDADNRSKDSSVGSTSTSSLTRLSPLRGLVEPPPFGQA